MDDLETLRDVAEIRQALAGRYEIHHRLGVGGMAEVFLGTDVRHQRKVAVKILRPDVLGQTDSRRFLREIGIAANLSHPNIVPLFDSGAVGSLLYYVMPYVDGQSLRQRITQQVQLGIEEALDITLQIAGALGYAHTQGIVHRDIKPENILLENGRALVADFGIAKALQPSEDKLTTSRVAVGTFAYMSPEQASGSHTVGPQSDIYSLAVVLYEMLAGDAPFRAATPDGIFARKALGRYVPLRDARTTVPETVDRCLARALRPVPADRFLTMQEFATALRAQEPARPHRLTIRNAAAATLLFSAITAAALAARSVFTGDHARRVATAGLGRVVVAPLENRTGMVALDHLGLMAGDWITEGLQKTGYVQVVPTATALQVSRSLRTTGKRGELRGPMRALALETGAGTVVGGAFYKRGESLLFRVELADQQGSRVVGTLGDVVASAADPVRGIEELRNRLMGWLGLHYDERLQDFASRGERPPTYDAYKAFSEGMGLYTAVQNARALPHFLHAYELDSTFTVALLYASIAMSNIGQWAGADSLLQVVNRRRDALNPYHRAWLDYRTSFIRGNREAALAAIRDAAREAPGSKAAYNHAVEAFLTGHFREALTALDRLPPDRGSMRGFSPYWDLYGSVLHVLLQYDREYSTGLAARANYPYRLMRYRPIVRSLAAKRNLVLVDSALRNAEALSTDPVGYDYAHLLTETAEEVRVHNSPGAAKSYFEKSYAWLIDHPRAISANLRLVRALCALDRLNEASTMIASLRRSEPTNVDYIGLAGVISARRGDRKAAQSISDKLAERHAPYEFGAATAYRGRIAAQLGQRDVAVARLREAFADGRSHDVDFHRDIDLEPLHGYIPFEIMKKGRD